MRMNQRPEQSMLAARLRKGFFVFLLPGLYIYLGNTQATTHQDAAQQQNYPSVQSQSQSCQETRQLKGTTSSNLARSQTRSIALTVTRKPITSGVRLFILTPSVRPSTGRASTS